MNELRIIATRPVSFFGRVFSALCLAVTPGLDAIKDKDWSAVPNVTVCIIILSGLAAASVTANAWFSTSSATARDELKNGNGNNQQKPV